MDFTVLDMFRTVAREQSVTRAAELLGRVPSNVTTRMQQLEAELGVSLFQRERKRMALTEAGTTYLDYVERILNLADEAHQRVNPAGPAGTLRVGAMEATAASRLPEPLARFNARWPQVTIDLSTSPTRPLIDAVLTHRLDCALIAVPEGEWWLPTDALDRVPLYREQLVLLLPPGHPPIDRPDEIRPNALAAFAPGCTYRMLAEEWVTGFRTRLASSKIQEVRSYHAMMACTAAGSCFAVLPQSVLDLTPEVAPFTIKPLATVVTHLASRPGFATPAFDAFRTVLSEGAGYRPDDNASSSKIAA